MRDVHLEVVDINEIYILHEKFDKITFELYVR